MTAVFSNDARAYDDAEDIVMTGEAVALELRPTGFVLAAAGAAIDFLVYAVGGGLVLVLGVLVPLSASSLGEDSATVAAFISASLILILVAIPVAVELLSHGKSLGRLAVGARIVREDGGSIGFRHAFIRNLAGLLEIYGTLGGLAAMFGLLNGKSKRMGDYFAGTYSQYERAARIVEPTFGVPDSLRGWATTADVARIPNRLAQRATKFLRQARQLTPTTRAQLAQQLATEVSVWVSPIPQTGPELFVAAVIALRRDRETTALALEKERLSHLDAALTGAPHDFPSRD